MNPAWLWAFESVECSGMTKASDGRDCFIDINVAGIDRISANHVSCRANKPKQGNIILVCPGNRRDMLQIHQGFIIDGDKNFFFLLF